MSILTRTQRETAENNIDQALKLLGEVLDDPALLHDIPNGATVVILPDSDLEQTRENLRLGMAAVCRGDNVYFVHDREKESSTLFHNVRQSQHTFHDMSHHCGGIHADDPQRQRTVETGPARRR